MVFEEPELIGEIMAMVFTSLLQRISARRKKPATAPASRWLRSFRPCLQPLEERLTPSGETGLRADLFNGLNILRSTTAAVAALPTLSRIDQTVDFEWGTGSPADEVNADNFSVRWTGQVQAVESGNYTFRTYSDDGARLWVNGQLLIYHWTDHAATYDTGTINLYAGGKYDIRLEYYERFDGAVVKLEWMPPGQDSYQVVPAAQLYPFSRPSVITTGGTYVGSWESLDPNTDTVRINTNQSVSIERSRLRGAGILLNAPNNFGHDKLTVRDTSGYGLNPNISGKAKGRFLEVDYFDSLTVENCYLEGTAGIFVHGYRGDGTANQTVKILRNRARNIDGRWSDGSGGYQTDLRARDLVQFFQYNGNADARPPAGVEVAWNEVINEPYVSRVEDNINIFYADFAAGAPLLIHDNYIQGAYAALPDLNYTGGGIMLADGPCSYTRAYNNQVVSTANHGLAITGGHDNMYWNNRVVSRGYWPDGSFVATPYANAAYIVDWGDGATFYHNFAHDPDTEAGNALGLVRQDGAGTLMRSDAWFVDGTEGEYNYQTYLPDPITPDAEAQEFTAWQNKLADAGITVSARYALRQNARDTIQAENYDEMQGVDNANGHLGSVDHGDYIRYRAVDFGGGVTSFTASIATLSTTSLIEVRVGGVDGTLLGTLAISPTGGFDVYQEQSVSISSISGVQDVYLVFKDGPVDFDWFTFA
jgi:hypothetical protein